MENDKISAEIQHIVDQLIKKYHPLKIILFGSAAKKSYDNVSDLDFLIIKDDVPFYGLDRMRELDELINRNIAVDMIVYRQEEIEDRIKIGDPFIKSIIKEGRVLYG